MYNCTPHRCSSVNNELCIGCAASCGFGNAIEGCVNMLFTQGDRVMILTLLPVPGSTTLLSLKGTFPLMRG